MFNHKSFATLGLYPGLVSTRSVANLGHFEVEVIIEPVQPSGGGGGGFGPPVDLNKYKVTIRVTTKSGKVWNYSRVVPNHFARVIAKVVKIKLDEPEISVYSVKETRQETTVKVFKK